MHVVGGARDYYDGLASLDREPTPVYRRRLVETKLRAERGRRAGRVWVADDADAVAVVQALEDAGAQPLWPIGTGECEIRPFVLAFCGRARVGFRLFDGVAWRFDDAVRRARALPRGFTDELDDPELAAGLGCTPAELDAVVALVDRLGVAPYRRLGTPVFLLRGLDGDHAELVRDPVLGPLGFASQVDPYAAWQTLDRFLGSDLATRADPPAPIDDTLRRDDHGFDDRSFKRDPGGPGRKRKRKRR